MERVEVIVIGAGAVGLAVAAALASNDIEVLVCEKETSVGTGITARNSEVIHAGIYYPATSLKAKLCVEGKELLYQHCEKYRVPFRRTGKLIVATSDTEQQKLAAIAQNACENGVTDLTFHSTKAVSAMEPAVTAKAALLSPSTGIVDAAQFTLSLLGQLESLGGMLAYGAEIRQVRRTGRAFIIETTATDIISANIIINCAGLGAQKVAASVEGMPLHCIPKLSLVRGNYFSVTGGNPFARLIYPVPVPGGLGIHATFDMAGRLRFGPDVQPTSAEDYLPDETRKNQFSKAIERYFPAVVERQLAPDYVGIRPQIAPPGEFMDFIIQDQSKHGIPGLLNLFGIESPGLTSALAIGRMIASKFS